ncbi:MULTISPECIES: hypothetical protein [Actinomycetes]|uniref:hypothetical protein n=1 Tax=Actinomycetes TaxID=1760 RepID=UPI00366308F2
MASKGIEIAEDGVAQVSMTDARAQLTRLIRMVREDGEAGAFTERDERRAYVVTPKFYEQAMKDWGFADRVWATLERLPADAREQFNEAFKQVVVDTVHQRRRPAGDS